MTEWKTYKIGDLCKISSSKRIFANEYKDSGIPFYRGKEIIEKQKGNKISTELYISQERYDEIRAKHGVPQKGDMLLTSVGTLGIPYIVQDEVFYFKDGNLTWFYNFEGIDSRYLYYWFLSPIGKMNIDSKAIGSTQKALTIETLSKFEISLPGLEEQRRIAGILGAIDDKIENNRRINTNLELQAQALFDEWMQSCQNKILIKELADNILDYTPNTNRKVVLLNSSDVTEGLFTELPLVDNINLKGQFKKRFKKGDILYSEIRPRNKHYAYCYFNSDKYIASTRLIVLRGKKEKIISNTLLYQYIISQNVYEEFTLKTETRSGTFPQGNYQDLSMIEVPFSEDQQKIAQSLDVIYDEIWSNYKENESLATLRDTLLPKLMNGELSVGDVSVD